MAALSSPASSRETTSFAAAAAGRQPGWQARLTLRFGLRRGKCVLTERRHSGPLLVQKPFYPEGPQTCHTYLIHPPGGVVGGDRLDLSAQTEAGCQALLTTPAAGKFYRSSGAWAEQVNGFSVADQASLEWLPQETIVYPQALVRMVTRVDLQPDARFIGWELLCLGLPAAEAPFRAGEVVQHLEIRRGGRPLLVETTRLRGGDAMMSAAWGLAGYPVAGILVATPAGQEALAQVRRACTRLSDDALFGATAFDGLVVCRLLARSVASCRRCFLEAWRVLRPAVTGRRVCVPRIWNT